MASNSELIAAIDSILPMYPFGVPFRKAEPKLTKSYRVVCVGVGTEASDKELFEAVVQKGLKIELGDALIASAKTLSELEAIVKECTPRAIIIFGVSISGIAAVRGSIQSFSGVPALFTFSLSDIRSRADGKRSLWDDLKKLPALT